MQFLLENAFTTPTFLVQPDLLRRIEPTRRRSPASASAQNSLMNALLQNARLDRMVEQAAVDPRRLLRRCSC